MSYGPTGLQEWILSFPDHWKAGYQAAMKMGYPQDCVLVATPHNDKINKPPEAFQVYTRAELSKALPTMAGSLSTPANVGTFYVCPSKSNGKYQGTVVAMLPVPGEVEKAGLPKVAILVGNGLGVHV
jgi:hypothetical protein